MNKKHITALKGTLPSLDMSVPTDVQVNNRLSEYFQFYGFTALDSRCVRYHFGALDLAGYSIATHVWLPENPKATTFIAHGLFDHVGLYIPLVGELLDAGIAVVAIDLPEHGLSSGEYGELASFDSYGEVLRELMSGFAAEGTQLLPKPWHGLGQSTGAAALMNDVLFGGEQALDGLILLAPLIYARSWRGISALQWLTPWFVTRVTRSFTVNSNDAEFCQFLKKSDPLQVRYVSVRWVRAMLCWGKDFSRARPNALPVFVIQGTGDETVDFELNLRLLARKFSRLSVLKVEGAKHHLVREAAPWRSKVYAGVLQFIQGDIQN